MKVLRFQDLIVWQKAHVLTLEIYKLTKNFPEEEKFGVVSQMRRSSVSICANIAEGFKKSTKDFSRFLNISEGSLEETKYYLILSRDLCYLHEGNFKSLNELSCEVGRMLNSLNGKLRL